MKKPIFNIIFIPDTVDYQSLALISMLLNSDYSFRLVGNALCEKESKLLESMAQISDRLDFINFKSDYIIPHGTLLDLLFHMENSKLFCFCDCDLFLFERLNKSPQQLIKDHHVFSSAGRIENDNHAIYSGFKGGATTISIDGKINLATTFFCVYTRKQLSYIMSHYKIGFEQYRDVSQVPETVKNILSELKINFSMFDTSKLLSVLYHYHGFKNYHEDIDGMLHLGGMSGRYLQKIDLDKTQCFDESELTLKPTESVGEFNSRNAFEISLKKFYGKYFYVYLHYLIGKSKKPKYKIKSKNILSTIENIETNIQKVLNESKNNKDLTSILDLLKEQ